jgi:kynurenine formamidase
VTRTAPFGFSRVVFLSHVIDAGMPVFPGDPPVTSSAPAVVLDVRAAASQDADFALGVAEIKDHRLHLENLCGLNQMPPAGGWIIIGGLRIRAGSGSPATVFGLIP